MRPWPLLALALLACEQGVPAGSPSNRRESERERQARIDQETEARRRREREAQLVEELEKEKEKNARLEMEERERDERKAREVELARIKKKAEDDARAQEAQRIANIRSRIDWLFKGDGWTRQIDEPVYTVWVNYALIPKGQRTTEGLIDAGKEALGKAVDDAAIAQSSVFFRRAWVDLIYIGASTSRGDSRVLALADEWEICKDLTSKELRNAKRVKFLKDIGFTSFYCVDVKRSTVTGNEFKNDEKYWPIK